MARARPGFEQPRRKAPVPSITSWPGGVRDCPHDASWQFRWMSRLLRASEPGSVAEDMSKAITNAAREIAARELDPEVRVTLLLAAFDKLDPKLRQRAERHLAVLGESHQRTCPRCGP